MCFVAGETSVFVLRRQANPARRADTGGRTWPRMARGRCEARPPAERGNPGASDPKGQARRLGPRVTAKEPRRAEFCRNEAERPVCRASVAGTEHEHERDGPLVTGDSDEVAHDAHAPPAADVDSKEAAVLPSERFSAGLSRPLGAFRGVAGRRGLAEVVARADGSADTGRLRCAGPCTVNPRARGCPAPQPRARSPAPTTRAVVTCGKPLCHSSKLHVAGNFSTCSFYSYFWKITSLILATLECFICKRNTFRSCGLCEGPRQCRRWSLLPSGSLR